MGDSGEGLIDAESRIQEKIEEIEQERARKYSKTIRNPELQRTLEALKLARTGLIAQLNATTQGRRKIQLTQAIEDIDTRICTVTARMP
jgi:hypothetical protein